jgi:hypothetical protein
MPEGLGPQGILHHLGGRIGARLLHEEVMDQGREVAEESGEAFGIEAGSEAFEEIEPGCDPACAAEGLHPSLVVAEQGLLKSLPFLAGLRGEGAEHLSPEIGQGFGGEGEAEELIQPDPHPRGGRSHGVWRL